MSKDRLERYYRMLRIAPGSSAGEIKLAYRKLAFEYHPDRNTDPDAEEKFKDITEAYEILTGTRKAPPSPAGNAGNGNGTGSTGAAHNPNARASQSSGRTGSNGANGPHNAQGTNGTTNGANARNSRQGFAGNGRRDFGQNPGDDRFTRANEAYRQQQERMEARKNTIHPGAKRHGKHRPDADQAGFVRCAVTDVVSAQPRQVEFTIVRGFLHKSRTEKITASLAPKGAKRMALRASLKTWLCGFWGWRSIIPAWRAIIGNMRGGIFPPESNAKLLFAQASAFEKTGNKPLARAVLMQASDFIGTNRSVLAEQIRANLRRLDDGKPARRVRDEWKQAGMMDALAHLSPLFVVIFCLLVAFGPGQGFVSHDIPELVKTNTEELVHQVETMLGETRDPYYIGRDLLNLRTGPGVEYPVMRRLARFETVYMIGDGTNIWVEIETALGETGFVNTDALIAGSGVAARDDFCAKNSCD